MNTCLWLKFSELHRNKVKEVKLCAACNFIIWAVSARLLRYHGVSLTTARHGFLLPSRNSKLNGYRSFPTARIDAFSYGFIFPTLHSYNSIVFSLCQLLYILLYIHIYYFFLKKNKYIINK